MKTVSKRSPQLSRRREGNPEIRDGDEGVWEKRDEDKELSIMREVLGASPAAQR